MYVPEKGTWLQNLMKSEKPSEGWENPESRGEKSAFRVFYSIRISI